MDLETRCLQRFPKSVWELLNTAYSEPARHYHTLHHLEQCFVEYDSVKDSLSFDDQLVMELSIWFHDAVYNPQASDNEEQSARLLQEIGQRICLDPLILKRAQEFVLATKHSGPANRSELCNLFLDIDLSVLGWPADEYAGYSQNIRKEYEWVPVEAYTYGRADLLKKILSWPFVFQTQVMRNKYESQARINLQREIEKLGSGEI